MFTTYTLHVQSEVLIFIQSASVILKAPQPVIWNCSDECLRGVLGSAHCAQGIVSLFWAQK